MTHFLIHILLLTCYCGYPLSATEEPQRVHVKYILEKSHPNADAKLYTLQVPDFPPESIVKVTIVRLDGVSQEVIVNISSDGTLVTDKGGKSYFGMGGFGYGEPLLIAIQPCPRIGWVQKKRKKEVREFFVPNPLEDKDSQGHKAWIMTKDITGNIFYLKLEGYKPFEKVHFQSRSCDENLDFHVKTEADGTALISYAPGVIGHVEGPFKLILQGDDSTLSLQHYWGKIALTPADRYPALKNKFSTFFQG